LEKLIQKYKEECSLESKIASRVWRSFFIGILVMFIVIEIVFHNLLVYGIGLTVFLGSGIILWLICTCIEIKYIAKKLDIQNIEYKGLKEMKKSREKVYKEIEKFQKDWITNYCKKNKINTIEKLKIIREEIQRKQDKTKYLNPVIMGSLLLAIWEILVQKIYEIGGFINCVAVCIFLAGIISIIVMWIQKEWREQMKFLSEFSKYSGMYRLDGLLMYEILKTKK